MANFYTDNDDLRWYLERGIDWEPLVRTTEADFRNPGGPKSVDEALAFYRETLEMVGGFVADEIAPHAAELDRDGVRFEGGEALFPPRLAGIFEQIKRARAARAVRAARARRPERAGAALLPRRRDDRRAPTSSVMAHHGFHGGMAMAMLLFCVREGTTEIDPRPGHASSRPASPTYIDEIARGEAWGCMDITEPDAGSDMARAAHPRRAGRATATGSSPGRRSSSPRATASTTSSSRAPSRSRIPDDPLRRPGRPVDVPGARPTRTCPTARASASSRLERVEEKLGHHGVGDRGARLRARAGAAGRQARARASSTCSLLMNNARLGVGFECIGLLRGGVAAGARPTRPSGASMGKTIDRHEMIADYLDEMRTDIQALRALGVHGAVARGDGAEEAAHRQVRRRSPTPTRSSWSARSRATSAQARRVTPLLKYLGAEKAVEIGAPLRADPRRRRLHARSSAPRSCCATRW